MLLLLLKLLVKNCFKTYAHICLTIEEKVNEEQDGGIQLVDLAGEAVHSCSFLTALCSIRRNTFIHSILSMSWHFVVERNKKKSFDYFFFLSRSILAG